MDQDARDHNVGWLPTLQASVLHTRSTVIPLLYTHSKLIVNVECQGVDVSSTDCKRGLFKWAKVCQRAQDQTAASKNCQNAHYFIFSVMVSHLVNSPR